MIIFVEGPDGSGKSTLINQLSDRYITARVSKMAENNLVWNKLTVLGQQLGGDQFLVMDRSPLTEYIYRSEDRTKSKFIFYEVMKWLRRGKFIYCNNDHAYVNAISRGEDNITSKTRHDKLKQFYDAFVPTLIADGIKVMYYDWQKDSIDDVIRFIEEE